jgi:hypothetical protein
MSASLIPVLSNKAARLWLYLSSSGAERFTGAVFAGVMPKNKGLGEQRFSV